MEIWNTWDVRSWKEHFHWWKYKANQDLILAEFICILKTWKTNLHAQYSRTHTSSHFPAQILVLTHDLSSKVSALPWCLQPIPFLNLSKSEHTHYQTWPGRPVWASNSLWSQEKPISGTVQPGKERAWGDLIHIYKYTKAGCKEDGARLFPLVPSDRTRGHGHKLWRFPLNIRKHVVTVRVTKHWHKLLRKVCGASILGDTPKLCGHGAGQLTVGDPAWAMGLDQMIPTGPCQTPSVVSFSNTEKC